MWEKFRTSAKIRLEGKIDGLVKSAKCVIAGKAKESYTHYRLAFMRSIFRLLAMTQLWTSGEITAT
jgi:hypothetical protein